MVTTGKSKQSHSYSSEQELQAYSRGYYAWKLFVMLVFIFRPALSWALHSQLVLPTSLYPKIFVAFHAWYCRNTGDPLMTSLYPWFQFLVLMMLFIQAPFELWCVVQFANKKLDFAPYVSYYAVHTLTCIGPSIFETLFGKHYAPNELGRMVMAMAPKIYDVFCILMVRAFVLRYHSFCIKTHL